MLFVIALRNLIFEISSAATSTGPALTVTTAAQWLQAIPLRAIFSPAVIVLMSECLVDWLKHAFITKFNHLRPGVYGRFIDVLCKDLVVGGSSATSETVRAASGYSNQNAEALTNFGECAGLCRSVAVRRETARFCRPSARVLGRPHHLAGVRDVGRRERGQRDYGRFRQSFQLAASGLSVAGLVGTARRVACDGEHSVLRMDMVRLFPPRLVYTTCHKAHSAMLPAASLPSSYSLGTKLLDLASPRVSI